MNTQPTSLRLRSDTADLHQVAERHPFQRALVSGRVGRDGYVAYLTQMLLVHRATEAALRRLIALRPDLARLVAAEQFREAALLEDLVALGHDGPRAECPATATLCGEVAALSRRHAMTALGAHYVLEGSTNGSRYIAKAVRRGLGLGAEGTRYLDPYGDTQPQCWAKFKSDLDAISFSESEVQALLEGARTMFEGITRISEDLMDAAGPLGAGAPSPEARAEYPATPSAAPRS